MATVVLSAACVLLAAAVLTLALRAHHWRRKADEYKGLSAHHQRSVDDLEVLSRLDDVRVLAARMRQHAEPDGLTPADVRVFADKLRSTAMGGEQQ